MKRTVEKEYKWEMCHRLVGFDNWTQKVVSYCDNCRNIHGHSYKAYIKMQLYGQKDLDVYGMVYDYNKMKAMKKWIDDNLDHCAMISKHDESFLKFVKAQRGRSKHFVIDGPSTAENISKLIFDKASSILNDERAFVCEVRIKETDTSEAVYREE